MDTGMVSDFWEVDAIRWGGVSNFKRDTEKKNKISYHVFLRIFWLIVMIASGIGMAIIFQFTLLNFQEDIINVNVETSFLHWRNTFPAVSLCLTKGTAGVQISTPQLYEPIDFVCRRINYETSKFHEGTLEGTQHNPSSTVTTNYPKRWNVFPGITLCFF